MALHRAGQAAAECLHRELQRTTARRAAQRDPLHFAHPGPRGPGDLEERLQHRQTAQRTRQSAAGRLCQDQRSWNATGQALEEAIPDLIRLERYDRRAWSRQKRAIQQFVLIRFTRAMARGAAARGMPLP